MNAPSRELDAKVRALGPTWAMLQDRTRQEATPETMHAYARYWMRLGLSPHSINETVEVIVATWDERRWPSSDYIAIRARHRQREALDVLPGTAVVSRVLDDWYEAEARRRWDERVARANAWREANQSRFKILWGKLKRSIESNLASITRRFGVDGKLEKLPAYREAFREGAAVGMCLDEETKDFLRAERRREAEQRRAAREKMIEDAAEQSA